MNRLRKVFFVCGLGLLLTSCAVVKSPVTGFVITQVKGPVTATSNSNSTKVGTSYVVSVLGLFSNGDASIETACKSGGITKIHHIDYESKSVLGIFATYKIYVYGE